MPDEQVLVFERKLLDELGAFQGLSLDVDRYMRAIFREGVPRFMRRDEAETNPAWKQIIPYVLIVHGDSVLSYVRGKRAGETRLVGRRSIGIGGHINPVDDMSLFGGDFRATYDRAVEREVNEEVSIGCDHAERVVALLNDDSTEVGQVHIGIVHVWRLSAPTVTKREQMITQLEFMTSAQLVNELESLESWSRFCVDRLGEILAPAAAD